MPKSWRPVGDQASLRESAQISGNTEPCDLSSVTGEQRQHPVSGLSRCFDRVAALAGIKGASCHSLRHTMVTRGFEAGFSSSGTSGAAGHKREMSYGTYRHAVPAEAFQVVEAHSRRSGRAA